MKIIDSLSYIDKAKEDKNLLDKYELIYKCKRVKPSVKNFVWLFNQSLDKYGRENYNFYNDKANSNIKSLFDDYFNVDIGIPVYTKENFLKEVVFKEENYDNIVKLLEYKKKIILEGPPGVGKTFIARWIAYSIMGYEYKNRIEMVQFHQSYSYEDLFKEFVQKKEVILN